MQSIADLRNLTLQVVTAEAGVFRSRAPLPQYREVWHLCREGRATDLDRLLQRLGTEVISRSIDADGNMPLMVALQHAPQSQLLAVTQCLLSHQAPADCQNHAGESPMLVACSRQLPHQLQVQILTLLSRFGAHPNKKDSDGITPLQMLLCHASPNPRLIFSLAPLGFDFNQPGASGLNPLMMAIRYQPHNACSLVSAILDAPVRDSRLSARASSPARFEGPQGTQPLGTAAHVALFFAPDEQAITCLERLLTEPQVFLPSIVDQMANVACLIRMLCEAGPTRSFNEAHALIGRLQSRRAQRQLAARPNPFAAPLRPEPPQPLRHEAQAQQRPAAPAATSLRPSAPHVVPEMRPQPKDIERYDIWHAALHNVPEVILGLLSITPELILRPAPRNMQRVLPLALAAEKNNRESLAAMLTWIVESGAKTLNMAPKAIVETADGHGTTALTSAVRAGSYHAIRQLLDAGANPLASVPGKLLGKQGRKTTFGCDLVTLAIVHQRAFAIRLVLEALPRAQKLTFKQLDSALQLAERVGSSSSATYQMLKQLKREV